MTFDLQADSKRASLTLYFIVALNTEIKLEHTINKTEAAQVLADLLQINRRAPAAWLRGNFIKHPLSRENFLKLIRAYRTKPGLENTQKITELAISIYGSDYKRAIELLDPADRDDAQAQDIPLTLPGETQVVTAICNLLDSNPEAIQIAFGTMTTYQWSASVLHKKLQDVPDEFEIGISKIIRVIFSQFPDDFQETFSKLGGLPELALYNLDCFETLWEKTGAELAEIVALFEQLNLIRKANEDEWRIKPEVLNIAKKHLKDLPESIQMQAHEWWRRFLEKPKYLEAFRSHLLSKHPELDPLAGHAPVKMQPGKKHEPFRNHLRKWLSPKIGANWEYMQSLSKYMSYDNFVFAQFLRMRRRRDLMFGFLISLWLGAASLLHRFPLLRVFGIGAGAYVFLHLIIDLYHCDMAWADLWETLVARAKSTQDSG